MSGSWQARRNLRTGKGLSRVAVRGWPASRAVGAGRAAKINNPPVENSWSESDQLRNKESTYNNIHLHVYICRCIYV